MKALKMDFYPQPSAASSAALTLSSKSWDHMPRRRRRFMGQMNLMLLMFLGCCIGAILWPQFSVAAAASDSSLQDFGSVTAKGENIFMLASSSSNNNGDDLGNAFPGSIQGKGHAFDDDGDDDDDYGDGDDNNQGDATNAAKMPLMSNARKEQASNDEDIEMMQRSPQSSNMPVPADLNKPQSENNRHLRYQQIQQALREPITPLPPKHYHQGHHHRHHHQQQHHNNNHHQQQQQQHYRHHGKHMAEDKKEEPEDEFKWPLPPPRSRQHYEHHQRQQHLRHHQRQHLHHHRRHNFTGTATTTSSTTTTTTMRPRYFDRDGLYSNSMAWLPPATQGPLHEEDGEMEGEGGKQNKHFYNPHNRLFNDGEDDHQKQQEDKEQEFKRISLSLDAQKDSLAGDNGDNILKLDSADDELDDDDDDYSYEDDLEDVNTKNKSPPVGGPNAAKVNVKRYTAPNRNPYKPSVSSYGSRKRPQPPARNAFDEDYDSPASNDNNNNENDDDTFSDEKWNKIEHEHYRKQQQHQRAMQALRSRRPSTGPATLDNSPNSVKNNKYSSSASSSSSPVVLSKSTASAKRPVVNEDDSDNIYSRYYVPGTVTRKKEEELGSPTSVLESRRQYVLQQRQNKAFASAHHRRIVKEGSCRIPQPRVERIRRDSWKIYTPHCTILHRCADDTGCCPTERQTCAPKRTKNVDLYFFVITLNETQGSIEKLTFVNHTECHCVDKAKQRSALYEADEASSEIASNHIPYLRRATILNCNCPNLFEKILQEDGFCRCDCSSGNMGCDWLKRGMEHFSMNDRKCILEGRCKLPTCEYGTYMKKVGRCPRREERQDSMDTVDW
ncbi:probable serine/threonine-protein kinase DDB_G0280133 [Musca domestica]|uniref:Probable serine/threonine-protein kinase DDB_G0280133 n=1 Tax=Musca domestica TaxID=7370 RepID=A0ABM3VFU7_MUSDO|nr:probable serine/threonine-protein kinase DDB_G0280133 [Musca domestica]